MSGAATIMAIVLFAFFLVGVAVGVIVVIAASARRADSAYRRNLSPMGDEPPYFPEDEIDDGPDEPPSWPARRGY